MSQVSKHPTGLTADPKVQQSDAPVPAESVPAESGPAESGPARPVSPPRPLPPLAALPVPQVPAAGMAPQVAGLVLPPALTATPAALFSAAPSLGQLVSITPKPLVVPPVRPLPGASPSGAPSTVRPPAQMARLRKRHWILALSFAVMVLLPAALTALYLWTMAADEYASTVGFSVRREENGSAMELIGGISGLSNSSSSDTDILYEFLKSQKLVADMEAELGLRKMWSKPTTDPIFAFDSNGSIEDLVDYWSKMVRISYDSSSRLIEVRVLAFTADDATAIAQALFEESSNMINDLSAIAREDSIRYAKEELDTAIARLKTARLALTTFRLKHQMVDPKTDIQSKAGLLGALQTQLTEAQIEQDLLADKATDSDPRMQQTKRRIEVIEARIAAERSKVGESEGGGLDGTYAAMVGEYERLSVDSEFAERSYVAALASYDGSLAEAKRKSRYLAAHILPTRAELPRYPRREMILIVISLFLFLTWAITVLVTYSLKDRR